MWALLGLLAGALAGNALWHEWGAVFGGLAGFLLGAALSGNRQRAAFRKPDAVAATPLLRPPAADVALTDRIAALELRVATLERALGERAPGAADAPSLAVAGSLPPLPAPQAPSVAAAWPPPPAPEAPNVAAAGATGEPASSAMRENIPRTRRIALP